MDRNGGHFIETRQTQTDSDKALLFSNVRHLDRDIYKKGQFDKAGVHLLGEGRGLEERGRGRGG